jgi:hypothetical protein
MREGEVLQKETRWKYKNADGAVPTQSMIRTHEECRNAGGDTAITKKRRIEFVLLLDYIV